MPQRPESVKDRVQHWVTTKRTAEDWARLSQRGARIVAVAAFLIVMVDVATPKRPFAFDVLLSIVERLCAAILFIEASLRFYLAPSKLGHLRREYLDLITIVLCGATLIDVVYFRALTVASLGIVMAKRFTTPLGGAALAEALLRHPARLLVLTFAATIIAGVVLLSLPAATVDGRGLPIVDALFTSTSATCVTGLATMDLSVQLSVLGKTILAVLAQVGGLGIMTLSTAIALLFGRRVSLRQQMAANAPIASRELAPDLRRMLRSVVLITVLFELAGTLLLWIPFAQHTGDTWAGLGRAAFHSIMAFCNAGFSLQSTSLEPFRGDLIVNTVIPVLVIVGGLGFVVISDLLANGLPRRKRRWGWRTLQVHTRLVLITTVVLLGLGFLYFFFAEFNGVLSGLPLEEKAGASFFLSMTTRTAGFNSVDTGKLANATLFVVIVLMFIGGSPGSAAGGIKTTTFAVLLATIRAMVRGRPQVEFMGRSVNRSAVYSALSVTLLSVAAVVVGTVILASTEKGGFLNILFESVSAFATVGLSTGLTSELTEPGKIIITILMFVGRLGPLTLALAMARRASQSPVTYPETEIQVG